MQCERDPQNSYCVGIAMNWEPSASSAAEMLESVSTDSRQYPQVRGARFAERAGRFTGMPSMTLRLRYPACHEASRAVLGVAAAARGALRYKVTQCQFAKEHGKQRPAKSAASSDYFLKSFFGSPDCRIMD
jgi:hypothetical protein